MTLLLEFTNTFLLVLLFVRIGGLLGGRME